MSEQVSSDKDPDKPEVKMDGDKDRAGLDKQDSVDASSQLSAAFTEDSLNSGSDKDTRSARTGEEDSGGRLRMPGESEETSDTETDLATTAVLVPSPGSDRSSLERERQEDLEVFGLHADMFSRYEDREPGQDDEDEEFFFDSDLNLEASVDDHIVAAELLRPERLDTVEEVSEPPSESVHSLPHDGVRWPEQPSQHTSLSTEQLASLNSLDSTSLQTDKEEMFSQAEMEFRNSFRSLDRANILRSQVSDDRSISTIETLGKKVGLEPEELTYVKNPFEIFQKSQHHLSSLKKTETSESVKTVTVTQTQLTSPETVRLPAAQPKQETRSQARIAQQLEEVRLGIFKLLSESDDEAAAEKVVHVKVESEEAKNFTELGVSPLEAEEETPGYQADEEEEEEEDSGSQSVEISSSCAQGGAGLAMGCVSGDKEERDSRAEDRATDSGIDRGQGSSRAASAEGWLARLTSRVRHSSPGSTPDLHTRHRAGSVGSPDSPRDGGFAEAGLEMRVRELWLRLAQMETEKLRAVEAAVEEERRRGVELLAKERLGLERARREAGAEREQLGRDREALEQQRASLQQTRAREADIVNKLQAKLVKYKSEAAEGGALVEQLSAQARAEQTAARELRDSVEQLRQQTQTDKVLHASEIQELQIRIEEEGEKVKTAETLAGALRAELAEVRDTGAGQEAELQHARQELRLARQEVDLLRVGAAGAGVPGLEEVLELSRGVATVRRQYQEMRHETVKEINRMKIEMAEKARQLSTACLEVYTDSQYVRDSQGNKILVGDIRECWEKLERVKLEKKVEEERADQLEAEKEQLSRELRTTERRLEEVKATNKELLKRDLKDDVVDSDRSPSRLGQLEAENELLRCSLQDIASMVAEDSSGPQSPGRPRPLVPGLGRSAAAGRRSRSSDNVQVTAAVQAALNTRQTQVYQLQSSLASTRTRLEEEARSGQEWQQRAKEAAKELSVRTSGLVAAEKECSVSRELAAMLQARLDTAATETRAAADELSAAREEIVSLNNKLEETARLKTVLEKKVVEMRSELGEMGKNLKSCESSLSAKEAIIGQLKAEKLNLEEEVQSVKERLAAVEKDQERLEMERTDKETTITEEKKIRTEVNVEIRKMKQQETHLLEQIAHKETFERKLKDDLITNESIISTLKTEILDYEKKVAAKESEISRLNSVITDNQKSKEEADAGLKQLKREKNDLSNQVTSISLRKDALEDEYVHIREEYQILKDQLDVFHQSFSTTSDIKEELTDKLLLKEKDCRELEVRTKRLEADLEREIVCSEEWRLENESLEERNKELLLDVEKKSDSIKQLNNSIVNLKSKLFESNRNLSEYQEKTEAEFDMERRKLEKTMKKVKEEYNNNMKDLEDDLELQREKLERKRQADINLIKDSHRAERERLEEEVDYLTQQVENLKARNNESFVIAENSRNTAEKLARTEESLAEEKIRQLTSTLEQLKKELSFEKNDHQKKLTKEIENSKELEYQLKSLRQKVESSDAEYLARKESLEKEVRKLKNEKLRFDQDSGELKMQNKLFENTIEDLKLKLDTLKEEKSTLDIDTKNYKHIITSLETQISEKNKKIQEKITEKHKEVEVLEKRIESYEANEKLLQEEIEEIKETLEKNISEVSTSGNVQFLQSKISELTLELDLLKKRLSDTDGGKEREERTVAELRRKLNSAEFERSKLENYVSELREQVELDTDTRAGQMEVLQNSVMEGRERERKLEDIRHGLELELNIKNQELQEMIIKLQTADVRLKEHNDTISKLEQSRSDQEAKVASIGAALNQSGYGASRSVTPVRGRVRVRSGDVTDGAETVRARVREIVSKLDKVEREKDEMLGRIEMLKLANENLVLNSGRLEEEKETAEDKLRNCQLQLQKLESKVSVNDESLAEKEETVERFRVQIREADKKVKELSSQLDDTNQRRLLLEDLEKELRTKERRAKLDSSRLGGSLREAEEELEKVQREKMLLGEELGRLHTVVREKDELLQAAQDRSSQLSSECQQLESQLDQLSGQLARAEGEAGRRGRVELELQHKIEQLQRQLADRSEADGAAADHSGQLARQLRELEQERQLLEERLENSKSAAKEARGEVRELETSVSDMTRRLGDAERGRQEAEQRLAQAGCNVGADNYLKEELNKTRKENIGLTEKVKELERKVKRVKTERIERSEVTNNQSKMLSDFTSERIVRTQIPLLSGRGGGGAESPDCGEHLVRIRLLEQEVERHLRRVASLEQQLAELEAQHGARVEELLGERRLERERDHGRHASSLKQLEHSLNSRERMYKERITGLEDQVTALRDQLTKEARTRRSYIANSQLLSSDVSELRRQLDHSLDLVQSSSRRGLDSGLLDREAARLEATVARQAGSRDNLARLTPSKLRPASPGPRHRSSSLEVSSSRAPATSTPILRQPSYRGPLVSQHSQHTSRREAATLRRGLSSEFDKMVANKTT